MGTNHNLRGMLLASVALLAGASGVAHASGYGLRETTADQLGNAFVGGAAKAYDASTVWYNPAGMALLDDNEFEAGVNYISPTVGFSGSNTNPLTGGNVSGTTRSSNIAPAASGSNFGVLVLNPRWRIGFSVTAPFGQRIAYADDFYGRYQSLVTSVTDLNFSIAASYKVNDHLSFGAGPEFDYFSARLTQALNIPILSAATGQDPIAEIHGNNIGVGYNLGALYKINDNTRIGLDYHSRIRHDIYGGQKISVPALYGELSPGTAALLSSLNGSATTNVTLPDSVSLGIYEQLTPKLALLGTVEWTHWALFQSLVVTVDQGRLPGTTINENWRNTWFAGVGANYQLNDKLMLQTGFAYDESPVTDSNRTPRIPDSSRCDLGFGVQYKIMPRATLQFAYLHAFSPGTHTTDYSVGGTAGTLTGTNNLSDNTVTAGIDVKF